MVNPVTTIKLVAKVSLLFSWSLAIAGVAHADNGSSASSVKPTETSTNNPVASEAPNESSAAAALEASKSANNYSRYLKARITESWAARNEFEQPVEVFLKIAQDGTIQVSPIKDSQSPVPIETVAEQLKTLAPLAVPPAGKELCFYAQLCNNSAQVRFVRADIDWPQYLSSVQKRIQQEWKPPQTAKSTEATVKFKIGQDGQLLKVDFEKRSSYSDFDQAAVRTLRKLAPFNPLPDGQPDPIEIDFTFATTVTPAHPAKAPTHAENRTASSSMPDAQMLPDQDTVLFTFQQSQMGSKRMIVDGRIDDRAVKWQLDTGAAHCVIGDYQMKNLGLQLPADAEAVRTTGFSGSATGYKFNARITIGRITRMVPLIVLPAYAHNPLLGYSFFKGFDLMVDSATQHLTFLKRRGAARAGGAPQYPYSIPFRIAGDKMMVPVEINGVTGELMWDTGADSVTVSSRDAQLFGLNNMPGRTIRIGGVGGQSEARVVQTRYIRVGPLVRSSVDVIITPPGPSVLGQNFLKNCRYTIDFTNNRILLPTPR